MSRSPSHLRRGLLGIAFVGSLGFGATAAVAKPEMRDPFPSCPKGWSMCLDGTCVGPDMSCPWILVP
ncbi:MAG TPA: hypothetical protein VFQ76_19900 [Longimicrobiaceae bacterium]|nr:hypothetical protein [Longimicrobiaceae bacterium]